MESIAIWRDSDSKIVRILVTGRMFHFVYHIQLFMEDSITTEMNKHGTRTWYKNRLKHRDEDKPAVVYECGSREWWVDGRRHRADAKPAIVFVNGTKEWWVDGRQHRDDDKPASVTPDGRRKW